MHKNYNRRGWLRPVLMAAAGSLVALMPAFSYAAGWVSTTWGGGTSPNLGTASYAKPALGDVNGDGKLDLLLGDRLGVVHVYLNIGTTTAPLWSADQTALDVTTPGGDAFAVPRLVDLNADNKLDLVVGAQNNVYVYQNNGSASVPSWVRNTAWEISGLTGNRLYSPAPADINGDGKIDLMLGSTLGTIIGYRNNGTTTAPAWVRETTWDTIQVAKNQSTPVFADLNGDGLYDFMTGGLHGTVFAFYNTGTAAVPVWTSIGDWYVADPDPVNPNYTGPALGDLNGDGQLDLITGGGNGTLRGYMNTGLPAEPTSGTGPPPPPGTTTVTETFDSFSCAGAWKPAAGGPNNSYTRNCGDGWIAYAQDVANSSTTPPQAAGPVGNQNVVTLDGSVNGPSTPTGTLGAAEVYTAPTDSVRGVLWLMKTYAVIPGVPIPTIQADYRNMTSASTSQYVGIVVFDGTVTDPSGQTSAGVPIRSDVLASDMRAQNCGPGTWCPWATTNVGGSFVIPTAGTITVAFRLGDTTSSQTHFGEVDNIKIDGVTTAAQSAVPVGNIAQLWDNVYQASGNNNMAEAADVATDAAGNVYITGQSYESGLNYDIVTLKYDAAGNETAALVWDNPVNHDVDIPVKIAVDSSGNIYVAGYTYEGSADFDYVVLKYNSSNVLQWAATYDNANGDEKPSDMVIDGAGNAYVTGSSCSGNVCRYATVKFTSTGSTAWSQLYGTGGYNLAMGIALDGTGNAYVTGRSSGASADDITTIKYDTAGNQAWATTFTGRTNDRPIGILTDSAGNSYVVGWNFETSTPDIIVLRYDSSGNQLWYKTYDSGAEDIPTAMTMDASGNLYVVGTTGRVTEHNFVTLKYLPDGTNAWVSTYGNSGLDDVPVDVAVDSSGDVYVLGSMTVSPGNTNFVTLKYSDAGIALSAISYDKFSYQDTPVAIVLGVDGQGDTVPVVVGFSRNSASQLDEITTVQYEQAFPDLAMTSLTGPGSAMADSTISLTNTVQNIDNLANKQHAESGPFDIGFYLVPDIGGVPDLTAAISIGSRSISNLSPGDANSDTTSVTIPASVLEGDYFLMAIADPGGTIVETDKTNNRIVSVAPINVQGVYPDLTVSGFSGPASALRGDTITLSVSITNLVSLPAGPFRVGIYLSTDTDITTGDTLIGSYDVPGGLAGFGTDTNNSVSATIPTAIPAGSNYWLGVIADDQNDVTEANENNNAEILRTGASSSTRLLTDTDFLPGLPGTNVVVVGTGSAAHVQLTQSVAWTAQTSWNVPDVGTRATPALADLNGDGLLDVMVGSTGSTTTVYVNNGLVTAPSWDAPPSPASAWNITIPDVFAAPALADLDGDGDLDALVGGRNGLYGFQNTGTNTAPTWVRNTNWDITGLASNRFYAPALKDLNGDGKPDLLLGSTLGTVVAYINNGSPTAPWTAKPTWNGPSVTGASHPALVDMDGDGLVDLMIGDNAGAVHGYRNTGTSSDPAWTPVPSWDVADPNGATNVASPSLGDLNGDGAIDLMYGDTTGVSFGYQNTGFYSTPGTYTSPVKDAGTHGGYTLLHYVTTVPTGTAITVDIRAGNTATPDGTWTPWVTNVADDGDISSLNTTPQGILRYVQYRLNLSTSVASASPALYSIEAQTQAAPPQPTVLSVLNSAGGGSSGGGELGVLELLMLGLATMGARMLRGRPARRR